MPQHQCIKNLQAVLEAAGTTIDKVVKVNVFLASMDDFKAVRVARCAGSAGRQQVVLKSHCRCRVYR